MALNSLEICKSVRCIETTFYRAYNNYSQISIDMHRLKIYAALDNYRFQLLYKSYSNWTQASQNNQIFFCKPFLQRKQLWQTLLPAIAWSQNKWPPMLSCKLERGYAVKMLFPAVEISLDGSESIKWSVLLSLGDCRFLKHGLFPKFEIAATAAVDDTLGYCRLAFRSWAVRKTISCFEVVGIYVVCLGILTGWFVIWVTEIYWREKICRKNLCEKNFVFNFLIFT